MPNISFVRPELKAVMPIYNLIRDCIEGEKRVKDAGTKYLPQPNPEDTSVANAKRYAAYKERAVFYNVTRRTLAGIAGQVFLREPQIELPNLLKDIENDATGEGISLTQLAKKAVVYTLAFGRTGIFVDYPETENYASVKELEDGDIRPIINLYSPWDIINWRTSGRGAKEILSLVVLAEPYICYDDGFEMKQAIQWRVLRLAPVATASTDENAKAIEDNATEKLVYTVEIWRKNNGAFGICSMSQPTDSKGQYLTEIPFTFVGSENNDSQVDQPPLYDLASLNVAHYRNSADYEESCYIAGQPTPYFTGLTQEWVENVLKGVVALGSRSAIPLPEGAGAGLLQAEPNSMPFEAMEHKERQMVALGAKLIEQSSVQRTATEADIENTSENSVLSSSAKNVAEAFKVALQWCARFAGTDESANTFDLHTDFDLSKLSPEEQRQLVSNWQSGAISWGELREAFKRAGIAIIDDEKAKAEIDAELASIPMADNKQFVGKR